MASTYVERPYRSIRTGQREIYCTREEWLKAVLEGRARPKPPEYWLDEQEQAGRDRKQASIIWSRHYRAARKYVIWDQASDRDFRLGGYL